MKKKRFEMRRSVVLPMEIITSTWDSPLSFITSDINPRGTYVISDILPDVGEHIVCSFSFYDSHSYCFFGKVARANLLRRQTDLCPPGFGIEFLDAKPFDRLRIRDLLRGLPPPVPAQSRERRSTPRF